MYKKEHGKIYIKEEDHIVRHILAYPKYVSCDHQCLLYDAATNVLSCFYLGLDFFLFTKINK